LELITGMTTLPVWWRKAVRREGIADDEPLWIAAPVFSVVLSVQSNT
jgi:hypothetical protein